MGQSSHWEGPEDRVEMGSRCSLLVRQICVKSLLDVPTQLLYKAGQYDDVLLYSFLFRCLFPFMKIVCLRPTYSERRLKQTIYSIEKRESIAPSEEKESMSSGIPPQPRCAGLNWNRLRWVRIHHCGRRFSIVLCSLYRVQKIVNVLCNALHVERQARSFVCINTGSGDALVRCPLGVPGIALVRPDR